VISFPINTFPLAASLELLVKVPFAKT